MKIGAFTYPSKAMAPAPDSTTGDPAHIAKAAPTCPEFLKAPGKWKRVVKRYTLYACQEPVDDDYMSLELIIESTDEVLAYWAKGGRDNTCRGIIILDRLEDGDHVMWIKGETHARNPCLLHAHTGSLKSCLEKLETLIGVEKGRS